MLLYKVIDIRTQQEVTPEQAQRVLDASGTKPSFMLRPNGLLSLRIWSHGAYRFYPLTGPYEAVTCDI
jgi:hypothetical protein